MGEKAVIAAICAMTVFACDLSAAGGPLPPPPLLKKMPRRWTGSAHGKEEDQHAAVIGRAPLPKESLYVS